LGDMVDRPLPTLPRQWASLGASHAPQDDVPIDSPRVAAAFNTFTSFVSESRQLYIGVRRSTDPGPSEWAPHQCVSWAR